MLTVNCWMSAGGNGSKKNPKNMSMALFFVDLQINFTTGCATVIFFCACNLGFSLGKDTGCTQGITQRKPPAITRTHRLEATNTGSQCGKLKTNQEEGQLVSLQMPQIVPSLPPPAQPKVAPRCSRKRYDACQIIIKNFFFFFSTTTILKHF